MRQSLPCAQLGSALLTGQGRIYQTLSSPHPCVPDRSWTSSAPGRRKHGHLRSSPTATGAGLQILRSPARTVLCLLVLRGRLKLIDSLQAPPRALHGFPRVAPEISSVQPTL